MSIKIVCTICGSDRFLSSNTGAQLTCMECGNYITLSEFDEPSSSNVHKESQPIEYKKALHFQEILKCKFGVEITKVDDSVYKAIDKELDISNVRKDHPNIKEIVTELVISNILKKNKLSKYYKHVPYIRNTYLHLKPKTFSDDILEDVIRMFVGMEEIWNEIDKKKYLPINYTGHKIIEYQIQISQDKSKTKELKSLIKYFPINDIKIPKLSIYDSFWYEICNAMSITFINSC